MISSSRWPKISAIISNYNGVKLNLILPSLASILKADYPNFEVIMVDNASSDNSTSLIRKKFGRDKRLKIVENPINMYSQGLNLGIKVASGEYIAFFNNDIEFKEGYFQNIIKAFDKNPKVALIQAKLLYYYDHQIIDSAGETMDMYGNPITIGRGEQDLGQYDKPKEILSACGAAAVVRRSILAKVGAIDADYGIGYEDMDLALRIRLEGFKVLYCPSAGIYHKRGKTDLSSLVRVKVRWHFNKNRFATMIKNYPTLLLLKTLPVTILLYIGAGLWEIFLKGKISLGLTRFTAMFWIILNAPNLIKKRVTIRKNINKVGENSMLCLFSKRSILTSFLSFVKVK